MTPDATPPEDALKALPPAAELSLAPPPRRRGGRGVLFAGVAGACLLGVGAGLWARPGMNDRNLALAAPVAPVSGPARTLQVVVDDRPAPLGAPMQVLPASTAAHTIATQTPQPSLASPPLTAEPPRAAVRAPAPQPPAVQMAGAEPPAPKPFDVARFAPLIAAAAAAPRMLITRLEAPKPPPVLLAKAEPDRTAQEAAETAAAAHRLALDRVAEQKAAAAERAAEAKAARDQAAETRLAEAKAAQAQAAQLRAAQIRIAQIDKAKADKARGDKAKSDKARAAQIQLAKAEAARDAAKADHLAKLAQLKADRAEAVRLAKAEAKGRAEARAEAKAEALAEAREEAQKQIRLASLVRTLKRAMPHELKAAAPVQTAKLDRKHGKKAGRHEAVMERASLKNHKAHATQPPSRAHAAPPPPLQRPAGLMKVSAPRCAQRDPGEALVCADPNLGAADRQLARAYQGARAAGVPDAQLMRQQQRWLAARTAAAREAPWAVHDVYMARIAELNGQAREAHGDGY